MSVSSAEEEEVEVDMNEVVAHDEENPEELDLEKTVKNIETAEVRELKHELNRLIAPIIAPKMFPLPPVKCQNPQDYPQSYNSNTKKEELVLDYVDNFKKQFQYIYPDRRPLFLTPINECAVDKFVCTTLRPTTLQFSEVYDWEKCARFVSEYLQFQPLKSSTDYPQVLWSPTKVLKDQKGNCFDYSILLASLLIGAGYDAYAVCGYATREVCNMDESRTMCPLLIKTEEKYVHAAKKEIGKYAVKAPRDLNSKYLASQEERIRKKERAELEKRHKEQLDAIAQLEKPPPDPFYGLRIHSWVMVLSGKREVPETFFIESLTANAKSTKDDDYLGIESVWNHQNYWVNMQKCQDGTAGLIYDLGDNSKWEYMMPSNDKPILLLPKHMIENEDQPEDIDADDDLIDDLEKHLDLPPSWVSPINITAKDFERRCPEGKKVIFYKKSKVEKYAPYLLRDNLVLRISEFEDYDLKDLKRVTEQFVYRQDKLTERKTDYKTGWVVEKFLNGRKLFLKEHKYQHTRPGPENERVMHFYHEARLDGLKCREETPVEMVEHFVRRSDYLYYRKVFFGKKLKKAGPADGYNYRPIVKIIDRFERNKEISANDDIAELIYNIETEKFQVTYHRESSKVAPSSREFTKPQNWNDKSSTWTWSQDLHQTFQAGTEFKSKKNVELYQRLVAMLEKEEVVKNEVRKSEAEVKEILDDRMKEDAVSVLTVSVYDTERNDKARIYKNDLEKKIAEEKLRKQTFEADYLAPFLAEKGIMDSNDITTPIAIEIKERCLADVKQRLIDEANLIQKRYEMESAELSKKQHWYQANQINMSKDGEQEYIDTCAEAMFRIAMLEERLTRHKTKAPLKYSETEQKLRDDPRLADFLRQ